MATGGKILTIHLPSSLMWEVSSEPFSERTIRNSIRSKVQILMWEVSSELFSLLKLIEDIVLKVN